MQDILFYNAIAFYLISVQSILECVRHCLRLQTCVGWAQLENHCLICDTDTHGSFEDIDEAQRARFYVSMEYVLGLEGNNILPK